MFGPKLLEEHQSKYSGTVRLMQGWGYKYVATGILTQSGGIVEDVWRPVIQMLSKFKVQISNCLILGLGAGTLAKMLSDKFSPKKIVGVEIDPIMIDLGRRHFALDSIPNLVLKTQDANSYLQTTKFKADLILVDMYLGDQLPGFVYSPKFLGRLRKLGQLVIFNHLYYDDAKRLAANDLVTKLDQIFPKVELVRSLTNLLIIARD